MIIRNEKDRLKAWALLRDVELPCEVNIKKIELYYSREVDENGKQIVYPQYPDTPEPGFNIPLTADEQAILKRALEKSMSYPDTPEPELGDHPSGMEAEEHW